VADQINTMPWRRMVTNATDILQSKW